MKIAQHIILAGVAALAAGCSNEPTIDTLSPDGTPTPLVVSATLNDAPQSRAHDKTFEAGDQLLTYIRHVVDDGSGNYTSIRADQAPRLVTLKVNSKFTVTQEDADTEWTSDLTIDGGLYWDDFNDSSDPKTDLRTANHYLQSFYGYCYNGGTPSTLTEDTGVLSWTLPQNFNKSAMKSNDLLWSPTQPVISYKHDAGTRGTLTVPYTHAMSKFTIVVTGGEGFAAGDLDATTATLQNMLKEATFTAPNGGYAPTADTWATVGMYLAGKSGLTNTYTALAIPGRVLTTGETLVVIDKADGNKYEIKLTEAILGAWGAQLDDGKTRPGVNYQLTVTINKQKIEVIAKITDWTDVLATGDAEIKFDSDITDSGILGDTFTEGDKIDIFHNPALASLTHTTTSTLTAGTWVNDPQIYWENGSTAYYFRALTEYDRASGKYVTVSGSNAIAETHDLLWGTTAEHLAEHLTYSKGAAINPRTGDVPLEFSHVMSKITVKLATPAGDAGVDLDGALITINGLHTDGTVNITNGSITPGSTIGDITEFASATHPVSGKTSLDNYVVVPQTLGNEIILKIRLANNTTYSITLNTCCVEGTSIPITAWEQGKHYIYTIGVAKEGIKLIALVKKWKEVLGSGDATLDWD
ncbi:MAG: fimbrillin family protein [Muribaculaceae bacterium]|nr:fimbrillin family protein [Muribaculaceae bacterium]